MSRITVIAICLLVTGAQCGSCPDGRNPATVFGKLVCCPGILGSDACTINCSLTKPTCFPFCKTSNSLSPTGECKAVPYTASDYTSQVFSGGGASQTTIGAMSPATTGGTNTAPTSASQGGAIITDAPILAMAGAMALCALA